MKLVLKLMTLYQLHINKMSLTLNEIQKKKLDLTMNIIKNIKNSEIQDHLLEVEIALTNIILKNWYLIEIPENCDIKTVEGIISYSRNGVLFISTKWWRIPYLALQIVESSE